MVRWLAGEQNLAFQTEDVPAYGQMESVTNGIFRVVANNPGVMSYHGTNTYLIPHSDGFIVIDPGPLAPGHVDAVLQATGGKVEAIFLTHTHQDHLSALPELKARTGARTYSYSESADPSYSPDHPLAHGDSALGLTAVFTPGHARDHLCYARDDKILFSGDHVMAWSTTVVPPTGGGMARYMDSLEQLLARDDAIYLPGHGPMLEQPHQFIREMLDRRRSREREILEIVSNMSLSVGDIAKTLYAKANPRLALAAERNVTSHLDKLWDENLVTKNGDLWRARL